MSPRLVVFAAAAALLSACGASDSACTSRDADLAQGSVVPSSCTAQAGATVSIPVNLCPKCSDSRAACQAEFRQGAIEIAPIFYACEEDRGCQLQPACENNAATRSVNCSVAIPSSASGTYPIINSGTAQTIGALAVTQGAPSCAFGITIP